MMNAFTGSETVLTAQTSFGQWLKKRRKTLDIKQEELAQRIGCAVITLKKLEADERHPSKQIAELLAEHLNIPADQRPAFVRFARSAPTEGAVPWGTPVHPPTNLPAQPTMLIGRDDAVKALHKRLLRPESRLLTLTGPPGIGKTRLGLAVSKQALDDFPDGVFFVALAPIMAANQVIPTISTTLGVLDVGPQKPLERLKVFLRDKQMLLVLDNFEQILAAAPSIAELLIVCPWLKLLVTSRAPLRIRQERQIPVSSLAVPDLVHLPDLTSLAGYSAVTLFLERAQAVKPDFALVQENAPTIAALCARLDGLPLAIELISARVKLLPPAALLERLHGRLMLQSDGLRDLEPRHRTLNAAIEWSYQLLSAEEQILFRRLAVFEGGWALEAAETVCTENLSMSILDGLAGLFDKNLIKQDTRSEGELRFTILETIREYALGQLVARGELELLQRQHANYFVLLAETPNLPLTGAKESRWWDRLEVEHANFRAALAWSQTEASSETGLRLALALVVFWRARGHFSEARDWLAEVVTVHKGGTPPTEADYFLRARTLDWLGTFSMFQGDLNAAQPLFEESLALFHKLEDSAGIAEVLSDYGMLFEMRGDYQRAEALMLEGLTLSREVGNLPLIRGCLFFLSTLAYIQGNWRQAEILGEESLRMMRDDDDISGIAANLTCLAAVALDQGDYHRADTLLRESLIQMRDMDERWQTIHTLEVYARLTAMQAQHSADAQPLLLRSASIFGATEALRQTFGSRADLFERRSNDQGLAAIHAHLDEVTLAAAWAEGRTMTLDQTIVYTLEERNMSNGMTTTERGNDA